MFIVSREVIESQPWEANKGHPAQLLLQCWDPLANISGMLDGERVGTVTWI